MRSIVIVARGDADGERSSGAIHDHGQLRADEPVLPRVAHLLGELRTRNQRAVEADERAIQALALHKDVQERVPDPSIAAPAMSVAQPTPMGNPRGVLRPIKVTSAATTAQHAQDPWQQLQIRKGASLSRGAWWIREALSDEGELAPGKDVTSENRGHRRLLK